MNLTALLQILSLALNKKDQNVYRMLVNVNGIQKAIFESTLVNDDASSGRSSEPHARDPLKFIAAVRQRADSRTSLSSATPCGAAGARRA